VTTVLFNRFFMGKNWSLMMTINGVLAGMVSACSACNAMHPWAAAVTGVCAGLFYLVVVRIVNALKVDDPVDAVAVHCAGGLVGLFTSPILNIDVGIIYAWNGPAFGALGWNMFGALVIMIWSCLTMGAVVFVCRLFKIHRVSADRELLGLDNSKYGEEAYPIVPVASGRTVINYWRPKLPEPSLHSNGHGADPLYI